MTAPDVGVLAARLGVSRDAVALAHDADLIDLHLDTLIPMRLWGWDPRARHAGGPLGRRFAGHVDLPRLADGGVDGGMWSITTNPFRSAAARWRAFGANVARLRAFVASAGGRVREVHTAAEYHDARAAGAHACLPSVQGLNALEGAPAGAASLPDGFVRTTLVHLTDSVYGATSSPLGALRRDKGLTAAGREAIAALNARRVFVDLAHAHARTFWDAVAVHDRTQPLVVTHTGVTGVRPHWRNLDDAQIRAVADTGGVVGIIFQAGFLRRRGGPRDGRMIAEHLAHVVRVAGEDAAAIGSDYDGAITPPPDLPGVDAYPRLVQHLLDAGFREPLVRKILGGNFLRVLAALRG